jgi:5-methylcytosine-specific restriction endonuclease McrA
VVGKYKRTPEIKRKQSLVMKEKIKEYDWEKIDQKRKETIRKNNIKVGRKKGEGPSKTGQFKPCVVCSKNIWVIPSRNDKRITCSRNCMRRDPVYKEKLKNVDRSYMKTENYKLATRNPDRPEYKRYQYEVQKITEENYIKYIDKINPFGYTRTLCGVENGWQLDHKIPIRYGFDNDIEPNIIAAVENLQMLPWVENVKKGSKWL